MTPFTDVLCIFADDFGGFDNVTQFLKQWIEHGSPTNSPITLRPRVIIVVRENEVAATHDVLAIENLRREILEDLQKSRLEVFSTISVIHLPGDHILSLARHRRLKEYLYSEIEASRFQRIQQRMQFTARHFKYFFLKAVDHVSQSVAQSFGFIKASRTIDEVSDDYTGHLINYLRLAQDFFFPYEDLTSFIASTLLMDAYPPRMHSTSISRRLTIH